MEHDLTTWLGDGCQIPAEAAALKIGQHWEHNAADPWLHMKCAVASRLPHSSIPEQQLTGLYAGTTGAPRQQCRGGAYLSTCFL